MFAIYSGEIAVRSVLEVGCEVTCLSAGADFSCVGLTALGSDWDCPVVVSI